MMENFVQLLKLHFCYFQLDESLLSYSKMLSQKLSKIFALYAPAKKEWERKAKNCATKDLYFIKVTFFKVLFTICKNE